MARSSRGAGSAHRVRGFREPRFLLLASIYSQSKSQKSCQVQQHQTPCSSVCVFCLCARVLCVCVCLSSSWTPGARRSSINWHQSRGTGTTAAQWLRRRPAAVRQHPRARSGHRAVTRRNCQSGRHPLPQAVRHHAGHALGTHAEPGRSSSRA